jgi:hypothetical protein
MFSVSKIQTGLKGVVGFRQPLNPDLPILTADVLESRSGLIVNDNPLVKIDYLKATEDYQSLTDNEFSTQLLNKQKDSIVSVCTSVFNKSSFIEQSLVFRYANNKVSTNSLPVGFIGQKLEITDRSDVAIKIKRVLLEFDGTGSFDLLLFNSAISTPLQTKTINVTSSQQEVILDWELDNSDNYFKGDFYIGYVANGLTITPFARSYENSDVMSGFDNVVVTDVEVTGHTSATLFDLNDVKTSSLTNGLNLDIAVYFDYTNFIIQNEKLFSTAILYDLQISCLSQYLASLTTNREQRKAEELSVRIFQEIEGQQGGQGFVKITGLRSKLMRSIDDIQSEIQTLRRGLTGGKVTLNTLY